MFGIFRKKSDLERLIDKNGFESVTSALAAAIANNLNKFGLDKFEIAYQFVLEELESASLGSPEAKKFAFESGISSTEFKGSLERSRPEVDGPGGPQQTVISNCLQLRDDPNLMVKFRLSVLDKIMRDFEFGKYAPLNEEINGEADIASIPSSRQAQIAAHVFNFAESNLSLVGLNFKKDQAEEMIRSFADEIDAEVLENYDAKVAAIAVLSSFSKNGVQFNELNAACMCAMSVIWAAVKMTEEKYVISNKEQALVSKLKEEALEILSVHRTAVKNLQAKLWISTTLSTEKIQ